MEDLGRQIVCQSQKTLAKRKRNSPKEQPQKRGWQNGKRRTDRLTSALYLPASRCLGGSQGPPLRSLQVPDHKACLYTAKDPQHGFSFRIAQLADLDSVPVGVPGAVRTHESTRSQVRITRYSRYAEDIIPGGLLQARNAKCLPQRA